MQCQGSDCGCAPVYGNDEQEWSTKARAIEQQARPPDRPGHPDAWSARDLRQWVANCDHEHQKLIHCEKTIHVRGRAVLARRPSLRLQPAECEFATQRSENVFPSHPEDNIFGDRNCPKNHVIDRLIRDP